MLLLGRRLASIIQVLRAVAAVSLCSRCRRKEVWGSRDDLRSDSAFLFAWWRKEESLPAFSLRLRRLFFSLATKATLSDLEGAVKY